MARQMTEYTEISIKQPVDRARRFKVVAGIISYCLILSTAVVITGIWMDVTGPAANLAELLVSAMMSLATATTMAYIGGSVIDYNGGFGGVIKGHSKE